MSLTIKDIKEWSNLNTQKKTNEKKDTPVNLITKVIIFIIIFIVLLIAIIYWSNTGYKKFSAIKIATNKNNSIRSV